MTNKPTHVLIIVQNLPVPLDRRVWLECQALTAAGYEVSVICPRGPGDPARQLIDGVHIYKYKPAPQARGLPGFIVEFTYSWLLTAWLSIRVWRRSHFSFIQACNPPDTYWLLARLWKIRGVLFVFDQHDLNPELFLSRFGEPVNLRQRIEFLGLRWLERMTYRTADHVISTNESYRRIALTRGSRLPEEVTVVRSGPDTIQMRPIVPESRTRGDHHLLVYLGIMGPQDDVDVILEVMYELVYRRGRRDIRAALLGFGDCFEALKARCSELTLDDFVKFTGRADKAMIAEYLSAADIGLSPDLRTPLNDISTMNKTMEYMAYALPSVSFDLVETRVSGADSVLYVESGDIQAFADSIELLLDDDELRVSMGMRARRRVTEHLDWHRQSISYVSVFERLRGRASIRHADSADMTPGSGTTAAGFDPLGRQYVDIADDDVFATFIRTRGQPMTPAAPATTRSLDNRTETG